jgi:hypothetical protein
MIGLGSVPNFGHAQENEHLLLGKPKRMITPLIGMSKGINILP